MKVIVQRVNSAFVTVDGQVTGRIAQGLVVLVGFTPTDTLETIEQLAKKIVHLRIFDDANGIMNDSLVDNGYSVLSISQFTLYADTKKGNRPSYVNAAPREQAIPLYQQFNQALSQYCKVETGRFGADMQVSLVNDGPVTISLELD
jgi:D-tyrosyl-tRNA(Tyr) deacylase